MNTQPEQVLENQLIEQLQKLGYSLVQITDESMLMANLRQQLEKHNHTQFSNAEFEKVMNILTKGSVFEKAKTLREKQHIVRDNGDDLYFEFLNTNHWCQNEYQVIPIRQPSKEHIKTATMLPCWLTGCLWYR
jgi:type I restriction enzyme R subunit